jgi:hypothetical protein
MESSMQGSKTGIRGIALLSCFLASSLACSTHPAPKSARHKINIRAGFDPTRITDLCELMEKSGSDKGWATAENRHNYTRYYSAIFARVRDDRLRIFEMGIGSIDLTVPFNMGPNGKPGASLRGWKAYFPKAMVFGADIDKQSLFREDRIETFFCDMTRPEVIAEMWRQPSLSDPLDIMIDDGMHVFEAQVTLLENSLHKLAPGGVYVVEDARVQDIPRFEAKLREWQQRFASYELSSRIVRLPSERNKEDNNLIVVQRNR